MARSSFFIRRITIAPDSSRVVFGADDILQSVPVAGGPITELVEPASAFDFAVTPNSGDVVVRSGTTLVRTPIAGGAVSELAAGQIQELFLSPSGTHVVFSAVNASSALELFSVPLDSATAAVKLNGPLTTGGNVFDLRTLIAPNTQHVVYFADQEVDGNSVDENVDLYTVPIGGGIEINV